MPALHRILIVDDEPDLEPLILQRMRRKIKAGLYEFLFAANGVKALEALKERPDIDIVISDINMPEMDGLTLLEQIRKVDPNIRAIIVSAYGDMKNIRTAMRRGAVDFITKPIDFEDFDETIERTVIQLREWKVALLARDAMVASQSGGDSTTGT
ncbi:MAG: response regulator [Dehalococcoidia bacterium]|nr:response regulator [Chloroflexota bacterium]MYB48989.1 response regulator [Dehalococcoidia bacterium]